MMSNNTIIRHWLNEEHNKVFDIIIIHEIMILMYRQLKEEDMTLGPY